MFRSGPVLAPLTITVIFFNGTLPKYFFLISFYEDKRTWRYCLSSFFVGPVKVKLVTSAEQFLSIRPSKAYLQEALLIDYQLSLS